MVDKKSLDIVTLNSKDIIYSSELGRKRLIKSRHSEMKERQGGYHNYFENLSLGRYKYNIHDKITGFGGPRTWKFIMKHFLTTKKIFDRYDGKNPLRILDIGCSSGFLRRIIEANTFEKTDIFYYGVDIREHVLKRAFFDKDDVESGALGDNVQTVYINHDVTKGLPFENNSFDVVSCFEMTKYLEKEDVKRLFSQINRVMKDNGVFLYSTHGIFDDKKTMNSFSSEKNRIDRKSPWLTEELKDEIEKTGLSVIAIYGSENTYSSIKNGIRKEHRKIFNEMSEIYPSEIVQAIFGPLYPQTTHSKLLLISKEKKIIEKEICRFFKENMNCTVCKIEKNENTHKFSHVFFVDDKFVVKYIRKPFFEKNKKFGEIVGKNTSVKIPKLIFSRDSETMPGYIVTVMEKNPGKPLNEIWKKIPEKQRKEIIGKISRILNEIHEIKCGFEDFNYSISPVEKTKYPIKKWKDIVTSTLEYLMTSCLTEKTISKKLYLQIRDLVNNNLDQLDSVSGLSLLHMDMNFGNIMVKKRGNNYDLFLTWDFETSIIGDRYMDVVKSVNFMPGKKYGEMLLMKYGTKENISLSKIYTIFLILNSVYYNNKIISTETEKEICNYIKGKEKYFPYGMRKIFM